MTVPPPEYEDAGGFYGQSVREFSQQVLKGMTEGMLTERQARRRAAAILIAMYYLLVPGDVPVFTRHRGLRPPRGQPTSSPHGHGYGPGTSAPPGRGSPRRTCVALAQLSLPCRIRASVKARTVQWVLRYSLWIEATRRGS